MSWMADHGFPHNPDRGFVELRAPFEAGVPGDLMNDDDGCDVTLRRDFAAAPAFEPGVGDPFLEVTLDPVLLAPSSLPSAAYMSSSTEISLLVRGRNVELLLDVDNEGPLAGFMACAHQPERVKWMELHVSKAGRSRVDAYHVFTETWQVW